MSIIDRYLLRQFFRSLVICYVSLTGLYVVFDAVTNLEEFMRCAERGGGLWKLMGSHYFYQSILFFDRMSGLLVLTAATFTLAWLQRHNEMTALMAAGVSRIRIVAPLIVAAVAISLLAVANRELIIPQFREELARRPQDLMGDAGQRLYPQYDNRTDVLFCGQRTYGNERRIEKPNFRLPTTLNQYGRQLVAENACYQPAHGDRPNGYLMKGMQRPKDLATRESLSLDGQVVIITPLDEPEWLEPDQCFVVSDVDFEQLTGSQAFRQFSSTAQLIAGLKNPNVGFGADVRVAIHSRLVSPFLDVTLLFLGLPLIVARENRNVFIAIGICMGVVFGFLLMVICFQQLGTSLVLSPAQAAWAPLILFVPPAVGLAEGFWR